MKKLFDKTKINHMELKNRFVRSATWEGLANSDGSCSGELAKGQVGLIITSHAYVTQNGQAGIKQLGIYSDQLFPAISKWSKKFIEKEVRLLCKLPMQDVGPRFN